jgi:hypothetical protein
VIEKKDLHYSDCWAGFQASKIKVLVVMRIGTVNVKLEQEFPVEENLVQGVVKK